MSAINLILKKSSCWGEVESVVEAIWASSSSFKEILFSFVSRECNSVADGIAKTAKLLKFSDSWVISVPRWLSHVSAYKFFFYLTPFPGFQKLSQVLKTLQYNFEKLVFILEI